MKSCMQCKESENNDDERFCRTCGADMDGVDLSITPRNIELNINQDENTQIIYSNSLGRLILDGKILDVVDGSHTLVGKADLKDHTEDPDLISRSHFTVYRKDLKYMIKDGSTPVQDKPSKHGTMLNGKRIYNETEIKNGDKITVSDIEITFEV